MLIIITGTIKPNKIKDLTLRDTDERLAQYRKALLYLIKLRPDADIVFCDNSNYGTEAFADITQKAKKSNINLEVLSFQGSSEAIAEHGKGYGEGEIVRYVLENSSLAQDNDYMIKITGRLAVHNISTIVKRVDTDRIYFNVPNIHRRDIYDTRLYGMPIQLFRGYFIDEYLNVYDDKGYFLEHAYRDAILNNHLKVRNFPSYPRITGSSGSGGTSYDYTEWKSRIRDFLSVFNVYGRVKEGTTTL